MPVVLSVKAPLVLQPFCLTPKEGSEVLPCHFPPHAQMPFFCVRVDTSLAPELTIHPVMTLWALWALWALWVCFWTFGVEDPNPGIQTCFCIHLVVMFLLFILSQTHRIKMNQNGINELNPHQDLRIRETLPESPRPGGACSRGCL